MNEEPITTATARSTTLPLAIKVPNCGHQGDRGRGKGRGRATRVSDEGLEEKEKKKTPTSLQLFAQQRPQPLAADIEPRADDDMHELQHVRSLLEAMVGRVEYKSKDWG